MQLDLPGRRGPRSDSLALGQARGPAAPPGARGARACRSRRGGGPVHVRGDGPAQLLPRRARAGRPPGQPGAQGRRQAPATPSPCACGPRWRARQGTGARVKWSNPARPAVLATLVAEIYGPSGRRARPAGCADRAGIPHVTEGVVDIDSTFNPTSPKMLADRRPREGSAARRGARRRGADAGGGRLRRASSAPSTRGAVPPRCRSSCSWPPQNAAVSTQLLSLTVPGPKGPVPLSELVRAEKGADAAIFHKNLMPVSYVFGDLAGKIESPVYALAALNKKLDHLRSASRQVVPALRPGAATGKPSSHHEVGRRVAHHPGGVPRSGSGLRRRADPHLRPGGGLVSELHRAAGHPGAHPPVPDRHPSRPLGWAASSPPPA